MTTPNHTPEQQATCHISLEKSLKEFLSNALAELQNRILLEMKNMMLQNNSEIYEEINKQEMEILLIKKDIENIRSNMIHEQNQLNNFKRETREKLNTYEVIENQAKGGIAVGKWVYGVIIAVGSFIVSWYVNK
jgi:HSP90 family molecular chaperone